MIVFFHPLPAHAPPAKDSSAVSQRRTFISKKKTLRIEESFFLLFFVFNIAINFLRT